MAEYIEREAAIEACCGGCNPAMCSYDCDEVAVIRTFPAADVAPVRHGRWLYDEGDFACSECDGVMGRNVFNYCPWCGAKMDGEA